MSFIGIDIGTTSICGVLYDAEQKRIRHIRRVENDSLLPSEHEWEHTQDPSKILRLTVEIVEELELLTDRIDGIGFSTQMHGMLYIDSDGNAVSPFYTWLDNRASQQGASGKPHLEDYADLTGASLRSGFGLATHFALMRNRQLPAEACKLCSIGDFLALKLTKNHSPVTDASIAHSFGAYDLHAKVFRRSELSAAGISADILPEIVESRHVVGHYKHIPVITAIGDNQAGFLGSVSDYQSMALMNLGTSGQISCYSKDFIKTETLDLRPFVDGGFLLVGASLCGGKAYALLANFFQETLKWFGCQYDGNILEHMNAVDYVACRDPFEVEPFFRGSRANVERRAVFGNISDGNFLPQHLTAGLARGIVQELYDFFDSLPDEITRRLVTIVGAGNLLVKNRHLVKLVEHVFGRKTLLCTQEEASALGAAINAAVGTGAYAGYQDAAS